MLRMCRLNLLNISKFSDFCGISKLNLYQILIVIEPKIKKDSGMIFVKSVQSALSDLLTTSATHGTFSRPSMKRGLISIIKLMQFTIVRFF